MEHITFGNVGEQTAAAFLQRAGYKILKQKYRAKPGEIDIIAQKNGTIIFVEVKTRSGQLFGTPAEAVTLFKQRKIINAALCFLSQTGNADRPVRFDVIEVMSVGGKARCNHIENAFGR
jgi:putative endonuclease